MLFRSDPLVARDPAITRTAPYQEALLHVLLLETSCFRYWGQGIWTDRARAIHRAGEERLSAAAAAFGLAAPAELAAPS